MWSSSSSILFILLLLVKSLLLVALGVSNCCWLFEVKLGKDLLWRELNIDEEEEDDVEVDDDELEEVEDAVNIILLQVLDSFVLTLSCASSLLGSANENNALLSEETVGVSTDGLGLIEVDVGVFKLEYLLAATAVRLWCWLLVKYELLDVFGVGVQGELIRLWCRVIWVLLVVLVLWYLFAPLIFFNFNIKKRTH